MKRLKILISAYSCAPNLGSEPGVGWNVAREVSDHHEVWVLTTEEHRPAIEAELAHKPLRDLRFVYYDLPRWAAQPWKRENRGRLQYYLWQFGAYRAAKRLHREVGVDLVHHVTLVSYWSPSGLALMPVPFIWGPVGGAESMPKAFRSDLSLRGKVYEAVRGLARWLGERDPLVRMTARRSVLGLATTRETADRLRKLKVSSIKVLTESSLSGEEIEQLYQYSRRTGDTIRFISVGRLLHWKGFHLGLRAFAQAGLSEAEYWVVGDGPERKRLCALAEKLDIAHRVKFWGELPREDALRRLGESDILVHPSLHDAGGWVCLEAMAAGHPVICLDLGGPAVQVTKETGFKIPALEPEQTINDMAAVMHRLGRDPHLRALMGKAARRRVVGDFNWRKKGAQFAELYREVKEERLQ